VRTAAFFAEAFFAEAFFTVRFRVVVARFFAVFFAVAIRCS
jgi:hypothetical protein